MLHSKNMNTGFTLYMNAGLKWVLFKREAHGLAARTTAGKFGE